MSRIMDTEVPDIGVNTLRPTRYEPPPQPEAVEENMTSWYDWLVSNVPETIRRPVSVAYRKMKDKLMSLFKQTLDYEVTPVRRLLSGAVSHHEVLPRNETISPQDFLREIRRPVISFMRERPENKVQLVLVCEMETANPVTGEVEETVMSSFRTLQEPVYDSTDLETMHERMTAKMLESFTAYLRNGSGWMFKRILRLDITLSRNRLVRGSSYIPLPEGLRKTRSLINVQNKKDNHCFKWAIFRHIHPRKDNPQRIEDLKEHVDELNWEGIEFPTPCSERIYKKFEKNNNISLLVFGHKVFEVLAGNKMKKGIRIIPLYVPTERHERFVRLFFFKNGNGGSHCCTVTNMPGLISRQIKSHNKGRGIFVCDYCLNYFGTQSLLDKHEESCSKYKAVKTEYPKPGENILRFKNIQNCLECPIKFYFDTESILKPIDETRGKTRLNQRHVMSAFCLYPVSRIEGFSMDPVMYVAKDEHDEVDRILVERMVETAKKVYEKFKVPAKMIFDEDAKNLHESATVCFACKKKFDCDKVGDHCHYTGKYRGAFHSRCNLKLGERTLIIPVLAHKNSGYDSHMFVKRLATRKGGRVALPRTRRSILLLARISWWMSWTRKRSMSN